MASGGAALCMMRQGGLFTANMNVEHVAATTQFSGNNERIQATRHNKESPVKQARLAISAKPLQTSSAKWITRPFRQKSRCRWNWWTGNQAQRLGSRCGARRTGQQQECHGCCAVARPELTARGERDGCGNRQVSGRPALNDGFLRWLSPARNKFLFLWGCILAVHRGMPYNPGVRPAVCSSSAQANRYPRLACRYSACAL